MEPLTTDSIDSTHTHTHADRDVMHLFMCVTVFWAAKRLPAAARQKCIKRRCGAQPKSEAKKDRDGDSDTVRGRGRGRKGERKRGRVAGSESEKGLSEPAAAIHRLQGIPRNTLHRALN